MSPAEKRDEDAARAVERIGKLTAMISRLRAPEPPADALEQVEALLEEGGPFHERLHEAKKKAMRSSFQLPLVSSGLADEVRGWNEKVLAHADACLPLDEASDVQSYPSLLPMVSADALLSLVHSNAGTLLRIRAWIKPREDRPG
jgi:hypothetical protein